MENSVGFVATRKTNFSETYSLNSRPHFSAEVSALYKNRANNFAVFRLDTPSANSNDGNDFISGERLVFCGYPGFGTIRYLQSRNKDNNQEERKKILDALLTLKVKHLFVQGCSKKINLDAICLSEKKYKKIEKINFHLSEGYLANTKRMALNISDPYYKDIKNGAPDSVGKLFKDKEMVLDVFGMDGNGEKYKPGQALNAEQAHILEAIDPVFIYFYLTPGVEMHATVRSGKDEFEFAIQALNHFFKKNKGEEAVLLYDEAYDFEGYFDKNGLAQNLYKLNCSENVMAPVPIINFKKSESIDGEKLIFFGNPEFGTIRCLEQPYRTLMSDGKLKEIPIYDKKKMLDALLTLKVKHIFQEGFFKNIEKDTIGIEELELIEDLKREFKGYAPGKKLTESQEKILKNESAAIVYYYLAPCILGKDASVQLHPVTTEKQVIGENSIFSGNSSIKVERNKVTLNVEDEKITDKFQQTRELCAILKIIQFFRVKENQGAQIALIFSEKSNFEKFWDTNIFQGFWDKNKFGEYITPRYFKLPVARDQKLDKMR